MCTAPSVAVGGYLPWRGCLPRGAPKNLLLRFQRGRKWIIFGASLRLCVSSLLPERVCTSLQLILFVNLFIAIFKTSFIDILGLNLPLIYLDIIKLWMKLEMKTKSTTMGLGSRISLTRQTPVHPGSSSAITVSSFDGSHTSLSALSFYVSFTKDLFTLRKSESDNYFLSLSLQQKENSRHTRLTPMNLCGAQLMVMSLLVRSTLGFIHIEWKRLKTVSLVAALHATLAISLVYTHHKATSLSRSVNRALWRRSEPCHSIPSPSIKPIYRSSTITGLLSLTVTRQTNVALTNVAFTNVALTDTCATLKRGHLHWNSDTVKVVYPPGGLLPI